MTLNNKRKNLYRFLARLYREEVDLNIIEKMKNLKFPVIEDEKDLNDGYKMLEKFVSEADEKLIIDIQVDFAKVFLGAGISQDGAAFPYESVYTSKKRIMMQEARDSVANIYYRNGFRKGCAYRNLSEDHIALEMEYMACLCDEEFSLEEQKKFFDEHIDNWVGAFCDDIEKYSITDFYKAISKITKGFLNWDKKILCGMEGN